MYDASAVLVAFIKTEIILVKQVTIILFLIVHDCVHGDYKFMLRELFHSWIPWGKYSFESERSHELKNMILHIHALHYVVSAENSESKLCCRCRLFACMYTCRANVFDKLTVCFLQ